MIHFHLETRRFRVALRSTSALVALLVTVPTFAQEAAPPPGEEPALNDAAAADGDGGAIVVTARRREESAQDVPVALSVVSAEALDRSGNFTVNQLTQLVPTLQVQSSNPRNSNVNIRGLGANSSIAVDGLEYGVGFYIDGVYYARPGQSQFDLVDLAQIEVLRGPQGTLFGKNTTAGALNITSKEPSFTPEGFAEAWLGNYDFHQVRASVSLPVIDDKVAVRLSVTDTHRGGFATNLYDNSEALDYDNFSLRGQLLIKPSSDIKIRLIGDYAKQKQRAILTLFDSYFTRFTSAAGVPGAGNVIANNIVDRANRLGYALPQGSAFRRTGNSNSLYQANMESYGLSGQVDWDVGPATLTSITAYRWWDWYPANDVDGTPLSVQLRGNQINLQRQFSQELRVASNGKNDIDYVFGLYYFWQTIKGYGQTQYGSDYAAWNVNPNAATTTVNTIPDTNLALTNFQANSYSDPRTKSYAAFGQTDFHITDDLTLTTGLRFTHEDKEGQFHRFQVPSGLDLSSISAAQRARITAIRNSAANQLNTVDIVTGLKDDALGGLASLSYKVTPDILLYASYSHGSKSGGLNITAGGALKPTIRPEKVDSYEIGFKSQFLDRRLTINGAAYLSDVTNFQANITTPNPDNPNTNLQYISNIPKVRSKGVEVDASYAPTRLVSFTASAAYTDAKYVSYTNAPAAPDKQVVVPSDAIQNLSGVRLPNVSKFTYSLGADLAQPVVLDGNEFEVYGHADYLRRSSFNATPTNSIYGELPGYGVLNSRVGIRTGGGKLDLSFWVRNLTDEKYYVTKSPANTGLITASVGDPRTFGATARVRW